MALAGGSDKAIQVPPLILGRIGQYIGYGGDSAEGVDLLEGARIEVEAVLDILMT